MKNLDKISSVHNLVLTSYGAGVSASNTAKLVKHTTATAFDHWEPSEVLDDVFGVYVHARNRSDKKTYKFILNVINSLEDLYQIKRIGIRR